MLVVVALSCGFAADPMRLRTAAIGMEVPFREYSRLLKIDDIDEYISYGGLLKRGEKNLDDPLANEPDASFRDEESTRRYIDTAIRWKTESASCSRSRECGSARRRRWFGR